MSFFPKRVLLATDESPVATHALHAAVGLSRETGSEVHLAHVGLVSPWVQTSPLPPRQFADMQQEARRVLDAQAERFKSEGGTVAEAHLRMGKADVEILRLVDEIAAELLVVGSRGVGSIERILLGSDAESIVRHAPCSVMVVRPDS